MVDKVKPIKIENATDGSQNDDGFYTESNPSEDYVAVKGLALQNSDNHLVHTVDNEITFQDPINGQKKLSELSGSSSSQVKVSSNDTTPGYLNGKLIAGTNIQLTENNDGSNETLTVGSSHDLENHTDVPTKPLSGEYILKDVDGSLSWTTQKTFLDNASRDIMITFSDMTYPYVYIKGSVWETKTLFLFRGTNYAGIPSYAKAIMSCESGNQVNLRIYDPTNLTVITSLSTTSSSPVIITSTSISNLLTTDQILEIQLQTTLNNKFGYLYSFTFGY